MEEEQCNTKTCLPCLFDNLSDPGKLDNNVIRITVHNMIIVQLKGHIENGKIGQKRKCNFLVVVSKILVLAFVSFPLSVFDHLLC